MPGADRHYTAPLGRCFKPEAQSHEMITATALRILYLTLKKTHFGLVSRLQVSLVAAQPFVQCTAVLQSQQLLG
jgi:hypothetical protein